MDFADSLPEEARTQLGALLPPSLDTSRATMLADFPPTNTVRDKFRGALIGGAIGDALGRPAEGSRAPRLDELERFAEFQPWYGYRSGPVGTVTDDTQMTMCIAKSLVQWGRLDPVDLAQRFIEWLPVGRGKGKACVAACERLTRLGPAAWYRAGERSAGNGAAMRVAPVGLRYAADLDQLRRAAAASAVVTHADGMAVASAVAQAFAVAYLLRVPAGQLDVKHFLASTVEFINDIDDPGYPERRDPSGPRIRLAERLAELGSFLALPPAEAFARLWGGAFVLESLPAAWYCFLRFHQNPRTCVLTAVAGGVDADTVAAMAGTLAGAYLGETAFPEEWRGENLEFSAELRSLADGLHAAAAHPNRLGNTLARSVAVPFDRSYWVEPGKLLAGCYPGDLNPEMARRKLKGLASAGIRHVVSLIEPGEAGRGGRPFVPYRQTLERQGVTVSEHPVRARSVPGREKMVRILDDIDAAISGGRPVYVHCWTGRGRTGTVVGCWLRRHEAATAGQVARSINDLRAAAPDKHRSSPHTPEQSHMIETWTETAGPSRESRLRGGIWGHLVGDAVGVPYEFSPPGSIGDVHWGHRGTYRQPPGTWSDDGGLMLAFLDSLLTCGFDTKDQGRRALAWLDGPDYKPGPLFDVGRTTRAALLRIRSGVPAEQAGGTAGSDNGNGSLMRILPVALVDPDAAASVIINHAFRASAVTHRHPRSQVTCALYCLIAAALACGERDRKAALDQALADLRQWIPNSCFRELDVLVNYTQRSGTGYVVDTFWSAWDAFASSRDYRQTVTRAIQYGSDTDSTACVAGGLAGIYWGLESIREDWRLAMRGREIVEPLISRLLRSDTR